MGISQKYIPQFQRTWIHRWQNLNFYIDDKADTIVYTDVFQETLYADLDTAIYICKKHLEKTIKVYE